MASVLELFKSDTRDLIILKDLPISHNKKQIATLQQCIQIDQWNDCRTLYYYIPASPNTAILCEFVVSDLQKSIGPVGGLQFSVNRKEISVGERNTYYSNRVFFYVENELQPHEVEKLKGIAETKQLVLTFRGPEYANWRKEKETPMAFISHDSRDKQLVARPLAQGLQSRSCDTWYDEYSLNIGDSLRGSIEKGIKEAKKCIVILSQNYLKNLGWGKKEFDSIFTRELVMEQRVILPIWVNVTKKDVYEFCPSLQDTVALMWPDRGEMSDTEYKKAYDPLVSKLHTEILK